MRNAMLKISLIGMVYGLFAAGMALGNGGPFVIKYPNGDPAAKGVLARLGEDLLPGRENRLRVVKEDLKVGFTIDEQMTKTIVGPSPLAYVVAEYTIENPTDKEIEVDFGFPILRGVYVSPWSMMPMPDVSVTLGGKDVGSTVISNSAIYGIIRKRARALIEKALTADGNTALGDAVKIAQGSQGEERIRTRQALRSLLVDTMKWDKRDAALMVEYASLEFGGNIKSYPSDRDHAWVNDEQLKKLVNENLGPLSAIGEQKATQFFAKLADCLEPGAGAAYEAIFSAWGGDVREKAVDMETGKVRPREVDVTISKNRHGATADPTIYARVDYLDENAKITDAEKESCREILNNLPVVFTFAPMNILHYRVNFDAESTQTLSVSYRQYAYQDTRGPASYQLAYVVYPASFWDRFGPINLEVAVPEGVDFRGSVACEKTRVEERQVAQSPNKVKPNKVKCAVYTAVLNDKKSELLLAVDADNWANWAKNFLPQPAIPVPTIPVQHVRIAPEGTTAMQQQAQK
jgi:hypothetical protein